MTESYYYLGFSLCYGIGPKRFSQLLSHFGTAENSWQSSKDELATIIGSILAAKICYFRDNIDIERYLSEMKGYI